MAENDIWKNSTRTELAKRNEELVALYHSGVSVAKLSKIYTLKKHTIYTLFKKLGIMTHKTYLDHGIASGVKPEDVITKEEETNIDPALCIHSSHEIKIPHFVIGDKHYTDITEELLKVNECNKYYNGGSLGMAHNNGNAVIKKSKSMIMR